MILMLGAIIPLHHATAVTSSGPLTVSVATDGDSLTLTYQIPMVSLTPVTINGHTYTVPSLSGEANLLIAGEPDLPTICRSVIIPDTTRMQASIQDASYTDYYGVLIAPSKGNLKRTVDPATVPYTFGDVYADNAWYPSSIVSLRDPYILRDYRGQTVVLSPVQYNPFTQTLRVYTHVTVTVTPDGTDTRNILQRTSPVTIVDSTYASIYSNQFLNYPTGRYTPLEEQGNMLIITYDNFYQDMVPFLQWKNQKGIPTEMVNVSTIGNANAIQTYIADYYNTNGLTFVLLVGDAQQVSTPIVGGSASDPSYGYILGNDHYAEVFIGRFSAENSEQVQTQVQRSVEYERDASTGDWYNKGVGIGSDQGAGQGDDGEADWQHIRNIRSLLMNFTYTSVDELYDGSHGGQDQSGDPSTTMVATSINDGRSILNYCGHGYQQGWGTTGFSNTNVNQLTNDNMLPFIMSVACNVGEFNDGTCFTEAWLRATHNGEPTGAIAHFGSTVSQGWAPPMEAEDEANNLLTHQYADNFKATVGGIYFNGCFAMNDQYGASGYAETDYWTIFGDPSLQVRTSTPEAMSVTHNVGIPIGSDFFDVTVTGIQGALCSLSRNGQLIGAAYTDATGFAHIVFPALEGADPIDLVVTAFNQQTYITSLIVFAGSPPNTPAAPTGPTQINVNYTYEYTAVTTDPDNDNISYRFDWGDGTISDWTAAVPSGTPGSQRHLWGLGGNVDITCQVKDRYGLKSNWSAPLSVRIHKPEISIAKVAGSMLGIAITVSNIGDANASQIPWTVTSHRALYGYPAQFNKEFSGTITEIKPGASKRLMILPLMGVGMAKLDIRVYDKTTTLKALMLGVVVIILPGQ